MNNLKTHTKKVNKHKYKKKKQIIAAILTLLFLVVFSTIIYLHKNIDIFSLLPLNVKTTECPDYVDTQFIHFGSARSGVKLNRIKNIVIHYVGNPNTTAQNNRDYFDKESTEVCSHFIVGLNGEIIQCVPIDEKSSASNNRNIDTISIEVCHPDSSGKFNTETYNSLVKLTAWLCNNSRLDEDDVIRHYDITGKECPRYYVLNQSEWDNLISDIKDELSNY